MKVIWIIAINTFREIIRDRILYGLVVFALLLIGLSLALGQLSFSEQSRITANFGFTAIHLAAVILSVFVGSTLVAKEIEKKTVLTLLARSITRSQFLLGKALGLYLIILVVISGLACVLSVVFIGFDLVINLQFMIGLLGILLESAVLLSATILFSTFSRPILVASFSIGLFLIGHWMNSLQFLAGRSDSQTFRWLSWSLSTALPNFERFNWRSLFLYGDVVATQEVAAVSLYGMAWCLIFLAVAAMVLRKRDFG